MYDFTEIFCIVDDFFKKFEPIYWQFLSKKTNVNVSDKQRYLYQKLWLSPSTIKNLKYIILRCFLTCFVSLKANSLKTCLVIKNLIPLINQHQLAIHALLYALSQKDESSYLWIDSTPLPVCKNKRIPKGHHALDEIASRGKSTMGWFYGCKLHLLMNQEGEIVNSDLSNGHIADLKKVEDLVNGLSSNGLW